MKHVHDWRDCIGQPMDFVGGMLPGQDRAQDINWCHICGAVGYWVDYENGRYVKILVPDGGVEAKDWRTPQRKHSKKKS